MASSGIGRRIVHYRRRAGLSSTGALERVIDNPRITLAVLRNIESGRRDDLYVSQLVEIARALGVSASMLLAPMEEPLEPIELAGVSDRLAGMPADYFDSWFSGLDERFMRDDTYWELALLRRLAQLIRRHRLAVRNVAEDGKWVLLEGREDPVWAQSHRNDAAMLLDEQRALEDQIDDIAGELKNMQVELPWLERAWHDAGES